MAAATFEWYHSVMTYEQFVHLCENKSVHSDSPELPADQLLVALWHDRRGHWDHAHRIAQEIHTHEGSALHAYLHREEGDLSNAQYWYSRAARPMPKAELAEEWTNLAREFCSIT